MPFLFFMVMVFGVRPVSYTHLDVYKRQNNTNVIYEICNEPNGGTSWSTIKKYAEKIIKGIRTYDKKAVILVGTPNWSQDVDQAALSPVSKKYRKNVMYTLSLIHICGI